VKIALRDDSQIKTGCLAVLHVLVVNITTPTVPRYALIVYRKILGILEELVVNTALQERSLLWQTHCNALHAVLERLPLQDHHLVFNAFRERLLEILPQNHASLAQMEDMRHPLVLVRVTCVIPRITGTKVEQNASIVLLENLQEVLLHRARSVVLGDFQDQELLNV
jgi:hypothetical protein